MLSTRAGVILHLSSTDSFDLFFVNKQIHKSFRSHSIQGEIWKISKRGQELLIKETKNDRNDDAKADYLVKPKDIFSKGLLISKDIDTKYLVRNFNLDTLYHDLNIVDFIEADFFRPIVKKNDTDYCLIQDLSKLNQKICFNWYKTHKRPYPSLKYKVGNKTGGIIYNNTFTYNKTYTISYFEPVFDNIYIPDMFYNIEAIRNDTLWTFNKYSFIDSFNYQKHFETAWKLKKNEKYKQIGYHTGKTKKENNYLLPNTFFAGVNYHIYNYISDNTHIANYFNTYNIELGTGFYDYDADINDYYGSWYHYGWGASLEYSMADVSRNFILTETHEKFHPLFLNLKVEGGGGVHLFYLPISFHIHAGYTTNFKNHFIRLGGGMGFVNLQMGFETLIQFDDAKSSFTNINGFYARYRFFSY